MTKETKIEQAVDDKPTDAEQPSYEDREQARELQSRNIELREQALKSGLDRIRFEQSKVAREKEIYDALENAFDTQLEALRTKAVVLGPRERANDLGEHQAQASETTDPGNAREPGDERSGDDPVEHADQ